MNKAEFITAFSQKARIVPRDAQDYTNAFIAVITEAVRQGEKVYIFGFGTFKVVNRAARQARNPQTGGKIDVAPTKVPVFKAGKELKDSFK